MSKINLSINCKNISLEEPTSPHCVARALLKGVPLEDIIINLIESDDINGLLGALPKETIMDYVKENNLEQVKEPRNI